jgi:hypothetical protein
MQYYLTLCIINGHCCDSYQKTKIAGRIDRNMGIGSGL